MRRAGLIPVLLLLPLGVPLTDADAAKRRPDLATKSVTGAPSSLTGGQRFTVKVKVRNSGNLRARKFTIALFLAMRSRHSPKDVRIGSAKVKLLKPHKAKTLKVRAKLPGLRTAAVPVAAGDYRVIACADVARKLKERREGNNCRVERGKLRVTAPLTQPPVPPGGAPAGPAPTAAFTVSKDYDWGFVKSAAGHLLAPGDPVNVDLTVGNHFSGQAGYTRSSLAPQTPPTGTTTALVMSASDDGVANVVLPFTFPFAGLPYSSVSVSTNGWVSMDEPGWDLFFNQPADFRGQNAVIGRFYRGLMPFWYDLNIAAGTLAGAAPAGSVTETVAPGNASITFSWEAGECCANGGKLPTQHVAVTLFPDGSFRYDYPVDHPTGGNPGFAGYSTGSGSVDTFASSVMNTPSSSVLYTPNALPAETTLPSGVITSSVPRGAIVSEVDAGCNVTSPATALTDGLISCAVPGVAPGAMLRRHVQWTAPGDEMTTQVPLADFSATYSPAGLPPVSDDDEYQGSAFNLRAGVGTQSSVTYSGPGSPVAGSPLTFDVTPTIPTTVRGLFNPSLVIDLPANATLDSIKVSGNADPYPGCLPPSGGQVTCALPADVRPYKTLTVTLTPLAADAGGLTLSARMQADNRGTDTPGSDTSPAIG